MTLAAFTFTDRAAPFVELGLGDARVDVGVGRWSQSHWDDPTDATWAGGEPHWLDVSCEMFEASGSYGRPRTSDRFSPGGAQLVASNESGWADPGVADPALLDLRAGRSIRFGVDHQTLGRAVLWRGIVDAVSPRYDAEHGDVVDVEAVCALAEVGRVELGAIDPPVGDGELAGTRIGRILNAAAWPAGVKFRSIAQTGVAMLPTTLDGQVADLLATVADSTGGAIFGDTEARVVFKGRDWQVWASANPPDATVGNIDAGDVCPSAWDLAGRRADIVVRAVVGRITDAVPVTYINEVALRHYGGETWRATDLVSRDAVDRARVGQRLLAVRNPRYLGRVERCYLDAATSDAALDLMATVDVFRPSRWRCRHVEPGDRVVFDGQYLATGVEHRISRDQWQVDVDLDNAEPWRAVAGRWDEANWDQATWSAVIPIEEAA